MYASPKVFSKTLKKSLYALVTNLNREDIQRPEALLQDFIGNSNAVRIFWELLHWQPKAKKWGDWVYKSWRDWYNELRLSRGQVNRVHDGGYLEKVGIEREIMKANGAPTNHYRLNPEKFMQALADFLKIGVAELHSLMGLDMPVSILSASNEPQHTSADVQSSSQKNQALPQNEAIESDPLHATVQMTASKQCNPLHADDANDCTAAGQSITVSNNKKETTESDNMKYSLLPTLKIIYKDDPQKLELYTREYLEEEKKIQRREEVKAEILPHVRYSRLSEYDLEQIMTQYGVEHVHQSFQRANTGDSLSLVKRFFTELRKRYTRTAAELNT